MSRELERERLATMTTLPKCRILAQKAILTRMKVKKVLWFVLKTIVVDLTDFMVYVY